MDKRTISIIIRVLSLISCCTFYVPDEYWQSTEVAHRRVYGYGYLTWEWSEKIRSYFYPFLFEILFRVLRYFSLDFKFVLRYAPHVLQCLLSIYTDKAVYKLAWKIFEDKLCAELALAFHWCSWFVFYTSSRTLSNTAEMCCVAIGMSYFPFTKCRPKPASEGSHGNLFYTILIGGIGCIIRPTSLIIWCPFMLHMLISRQLPLRDLLFSTLLALPPLLYLSFGLDYHFYQQFTFVHLNFLKFNLFQNLSGFYGTHPFHWYFTQGIPVVFSFHVIFILYGVIHSRRTWYMAGIAFFYILVHSCIPHKEFRFLLPVFPILMPYAGYGLKLLTGFYSWFWLIYLMIVAVVNALVGGYFSVIHQRGTISVMSYLRDQQLNVHNDSVLFLMPCHSTPFYSHLLHKVDMKFLTCEPNFKSDPGYVDEADQFYENPGHWIEKKYLLPSHRYSHVVLFDVLSLKVDGKLRSMGYAKEITFFHTHLPEGRVGRYVDVYIKKKQNG